MFQIFAPVLILLSCVTVAFSLKCHKNPEAPVPTEKYFGEWTSAQPNRDRNYGRLQCHCEIWLQIGRSCGDETCFSGTIKAEEDTSEWEPAIQDYKFNEAIWFTNHLTGEQFDITQLAFPNPDIASVTRMVIYHVYGNGNRFDAYKALRGYTFATQSRAGDLKMTVTRKIIISQAAVYPLYTMLEIMFSDPKHDYQKRQVVSRCRNALNGITFAIGRMRPVRTRLVRTRSTRSLAGSSVTSKARRRSTRSSMGGVSTESGEASKRGLSSSPPLTRSPSPNE